MNRPFPMLVLLLMALSGATGAGIYRWTDDQGNVVYSQSPPPDRRTARRLSLPSPSPAETEAARQRLESQQRRLKESAEQRREAAKAQRQKQEQEALRRRNCETARANLETLNSRPPNTLYRIGEGDYRRLTMEELEQKRQALRQAIAENCK